MPKRNMNRIIVCVVLLLALLCVCVCAFAEGEPALRFENDEVTVAVKKTVKVSPAAENVEKPKALKYTWASGDEQIATVQNGTVKGIAPGETTVTCSTELPEGKQLSATLKVRVVEPVKTLKIETKANTRVNVGETLPMEHTIQPENATDKSLTWESNDQSIATVDSTGAVTAVAPGKVTITATTNDGSKKTAKVSLHVPSLRCDTAEVTVDKPEGATFTLDYYGDDWDNNVMVKADGNFYEYTAEQDGNKVNFWVSAGSAGKGKLTIKDKKDPQATVTVPVTATENGIALGSLVTIQNAHVKSDEVELIVKNNGSQLVTRVCVIFIPRDKDGNIQYMTEASAAGAGHECVFCHISRRMGPGKTAKQAFSETGTYYPNMTQMDCAVFSITLADGTYIRFPENDLRWFCSSEKKYITFPKDRNTNCYPGDEIYEKGKADELGIVTYNTLMSWHGEHYGYHNVGVVVTSVEENSIAAKAGLQATDLIVAVNGLTYEENPYTLTIGKAEMADTGKMTLTVERYGEEDTYEVELTQEK